MPINFVMQGKCLFSDISRPGQGSKIVLVRSYLRVPKAAGQVKILKFLVKIKFYPYMPIIFVMQGKCLFSDISRPAGYEIFYWVKLWIFSYSLALTIVLGAKENHLIETILLSTHNTCF